MFFYVIYNVNFINPLFKIVYLHGKLDLEIQISKGGGGTELYLYGALDTFPN